MLFLIRGCTFSACRYYGNIINKVKPSPLCPLLLNLNKKDPSICKFFSAEKYSITLDENIKKYLNRLTDVYQNNEKQMNESINEILKLETIPELLDKKIKIIENIKSLTNLASNDEEMKKLVKEEQLMYQQELVEVDKHILDVILQTLGKEYFDQIIMEIVAGAGGQEAMLFAKDLFNMYINYLNYLEYEYEVLEMSVSPISGLRKGVILISDSRAFEKLKYEGGIHRVQRVPVTEKSGRMHTSTVFVTIFPEPRDVDIKLEEKDLKIESKRASGAGGQHVNTTDSAIRITHLPTGISVTNQTDRSQLKNKKVALMKLKSILYQIEMDKQVSFITALRKKQMTKLEKIRTYNFNQDRITDHRILDGTMHNLKGFLKDGLPLVELQDRLYKDMQHETLLEILKSLESELK
ncbi:mitochondrial translation release factor 1 [Megachile rotundata]|uniref:mitochondrial translation release factor 1 n=1 Tax=Megachile rotundata TaxID=143995 RepID=UPI00061523AC|nr:PREDICTED: peptide chain release factor 1-like, mitochondrial isoform X1 [Megachile rotundata]